MYREFQTVRIKLFQYVLKIKSNKWKEHSFLELYQFKSYLVFLYFFSKHTSYYSFLYEPSINPSVDSSFKVKPSHRHFISSFTPIIALRDSWSGIAHCSHSRAFPNSKSYQGFQPILNVCDASSQGTTSWK